MLPRPTSWTESQERVPKDLGAALETGTIYCCESDSVVHEAKKFDFPGIKFLGEFPHRAAHKAPALVTFSSLLLTANRFSSQQ